MEHPTPLRIVKEIPGVIHTLCQASPSGQQHAIETYFTPTASFTHPFCRTGSFNGSRTLISYIYRWYKILSPKIDIQIDSIAFDQQAMLLYVSMHQVFSIWILPYHKANVSITTVLHLVKSESLAESGAPHERKHAQHTEGRTKYYIQSQQDMYQTSEFIKFVLPWFGIGTITIMLWQFIATFFCVVGAIMLWPISWLEENVVGGNKERSIRDVVGVEGYQAQ